MLLVYEPVNHIFKSCVTDKYMNSVVGLPVFAFLGSTKAHFGPFMVIMFY